MDGDTMYPFFFLNRITWKQTWYSSNILWWCKSTILSYRNGFRLCWQSLLLIFPTLFLLFFLEKVEPFLKIVKNTLSYIIYVSVQCYMTWTTEIYNNNKIYETYLKYMRYKVHKISMKLIIYMINTHKNTHRYIYIFIYIYI